jgi:hypothetical protein
MPHQADSTLGVSPARRTTVAGLAAVAAVIGQIIPNTYEQRSTTLTTAA